jgi:NAD(P)-dependent dehydrogenase (short-subunit alcohol dehydrogenase family)
VHKEISEMFDLSSKVALVVGGARGLGFDMASALAGGGCDVAITSRDIEHARKPAEILAEKYQVNSLPLQLDHTQPDQVAQVAQKAQAWKGHIDILINNAGGGGDDEGAQRLLDRSEKDVASLINNNLTAPLSCCKHIGQIMAKQGHGKIINIGSIAGLLGRDRRMYDRSNLDGQPIDYAAAKAGVIGMTKDLAAYLGPKGIHVNSLSPGGFQRNQSDGFVKDYSDRTPLGRMGREGIDLKGAILFLASSASDYVTGHDLVVDGGWSIWQ